MGHGCIIIFMINGTQVKIGFQGSESVFYFSDCVVNIPYNYFVLHIEIGTQKIDTQVICLVVMLCFIFLPANICCQLGCFVLAYFYVVILLYRWIFFFCPADALMHFVYFFNASFAVYSSMYFL